jgi:hypothetical protein
MYIRKVSNCETVIPLNQTLAARWIVQSPANKIEDGDVLPGGLNRVNCPPIRAQPPANRDIKYMQSKQLSERIVDVLSLQPSTTYRLGMKWLSGFHTALRTGKLEEFTGQGLADTSGFQNLSQVSSVGDVTASQISFADPGPSSQPEAKSQEKCAEEAGSSGRAPIVFASPPRRRGLTRRAERKDESDREMRAAKKIMARVREGKKQVVVKLAHMVALRGPYSSSTAKPFLDKLNLPSVDLELRRFNIGQSVPVITGIPQLEAIREAIATMGRTDKEGMLARWDDYGYPTYGQLKLMDTVVTAKNNIGLVHATLNWITALGFQVNSVVEPFKDQLDTTKVSCS